MSIIDLMMQQEAAKILGDYSKPSGGGLLGGLF